MRTSTILKVMTCAAALQVAGGAALAQEEKSPWQVRVRLIDVAPDESSTVTVAGTVGGEANVDSAVVPELDISYFFTPNIAAELILATTKHNVTGTNTAAGDVDLGHTWVLPPTLTLQYHLNPEGQFRPYVGAGINYTFFYSSDAGDFDTINYKNGFGWALQAGTDIAIDDHWAVNLDVKKLWLNTDVTVNDGLATADVDLDPWVFGAGIAYRF